MARNLSVVQFQQLMARIPPVVAKELAKAVEDGAEKLAQAQRSTVPVDKGTLRDSIRVTAGKHALQRRVVAGGAGTTKNGYDYALGQEFGNEQSPAQPFFWPSYRSKKRSIRSGITRKVKPAMAKVVNVK